MFNRIKVFFINSLSLCIPTTSEALSFPKHVK